MISAVHYLHMNNIVHLDIKLENFLVDETNNTVKLIDFESALWKNRYMNNCMLRYTEYYISPEFYHDKIHGFHNDIWALGLTLFTFFEYMDIIDIRNVCLSGEIPILAFTSHTPKIYRLIIEKCFVYDYMERITSDEIKKIILKNNF